MKSFIRIQLFLFLLSVPSIIYCMDPFKSPFLKMPFGIEQKFEKTDIDNLWNSYKKLPTDPEVMQLKRRLSQFDLDKNLGLYVAFCNYKNWQTNEKERGELLEGLKKIALYVAAGADPTGKWFPNDPNLYAEVYLGTTKKQGLEVDTIIS